MEPIGISRHLMGLGLSRWQRIARPFRGLNVKVVLLTTEAVLTITAGGGAAALGFQRVHALNKRQP